MRSFKLYIIFALLGLGILSAGFYASAQSPYTALYWIVGDIVKEAGAPVGLSVDGLEVVFYKDGTDPLVAGTSYSKDTSGATGLSGRSGEYAMNAFEHWGMPVVPGDDYNVATMQKDGYGAGPTKFTLRGTGYDRVPLTLVAGGGLAGVLPQPQEPPPTIRIWFGNRLYQPDIYGLEADGKREFVVSGTGTIKIEVSIEPPPHVLNESASYIVELDHPVEGLKTYNLSTDAPGFSAQAVGASTLVINSSYPEELEAITEKTIYTFTFNAASSGDFGIATAVTTQAVIAVLGGPLRITDVPLPYPAPFSPTDHGQVWIQYTLSRDADIEIFIVSIAGETVTRIFRQSGSDGGSAGLNKVPWNGRNVAGEIVGNGVYVGTIISRDENRLLAKFKLTVFD